MTLSIRKFRIIVLVRIIVCEYSKFRIESNSYFSIRFDSKFRIFAQHYLLEDCQTHGGNTSLYLVLFPAWHDSRFSKLLQLHLSLPFSCFVSVSTHHNSNTAFYCQFNAMHCMRQNIKSPVVCVRVCVCARVFGAEYLLNA